MSSLIVERYSEEKKAEEPVDIIAKEDGTPSWRGGTSWRRDNVWVQEFEPEKGYQNNGSAEGSGRCVGQVQVIITVLDHQRPNSKGRPQRYTGALFELKRWINRGATHPVHGMHEVENFPPNTSQNSRLLGPRRFYDLSHIIRSAHLVPANQARTRFYVNNFIDWDQYNTVYDPDFMASGKQTADEWEKQKRQEKCKTRKKRKS